MTEVNNSSNNSCISNCWNYVCNNKDKIKTAAVATLATAVTAATIYAIYKAYLINNMHDSFHKAANSYGEIDLKFGVDSKGKCVNSYPWTKVQTTNKLNYCALTFKDRHEASMLCDSISNSKRSSTKINRFANTTFTSECPATAKTTGPTLKQIVQEADKHYPGHPFACDKTLEYHCSRYTILSRERNENYTRGVEEFLQKHNSWSDLYNINGFRAQLAYTDTEATPNTWTLTTTVCKNEHNGRYDYRFQNWLNS